MKISKYVILGISVAVFGSILFGFNLAVIAGALLYISEEFHLIVFEEGFLVSILIFGAIFGAFFGGRLADKIGRKNSLFVTSFIFLLGVVAAVQRDYVFIVIGRGIQGIGVGIVSVVVPLYIAEISPAKYRGRFVSLNQLFISFGMLIGYIVNYIFFSWRFMIGFSIIFVFLFMIGLLFILETPSYLFAKNKFMKGEKVLKKLKIEFLESHKKEKKEKFFKNNKKPLIIGIGISVIQQITGINAILFFAPKIFSSLKFLDFSSSILVSVAIGMILFLLTIFSLFLIDTMGRKRLLLIGSFGMGLCMLFLAISFYFEKDVFFKIFFIILYVGFFAISLGPITWLLISEIFPLKSRGEAMGICAFFNWGFNCLISFTFLPLLKILKASNMFFLFSIISFLSFYFILKKVFETKNKTFEEIQSFWKK